MESSPLNSITTVVFCPLTVIREISHSSWAVPSHHHGFH
jgi:hypothetical protein